MLEFKVNDYITLKLKDEVTIIYVKSKEFLQCKYLLLINPHEEERYWEIDSIDEVKEIQNSKLEQEIDPIELGITPEDEFWGHCSNIQMWVEQKYDSRFLHSNLVFPLLKELVNAGDLLAKRKFKEELIKKFESSFIPTLWYLIEENYLNYFTDEEIFTILKDIEEKNEKVYKLLLALLFSKEFLISKFNNKELIDFINDFEYKFEIGYFDEIYFGDHLLRKITSIFTKLRRIKKEITLNHQHHI